MNILFVGKNISIVNSYESINIISPTKKLGHDVFIYDLLLDSKINQIDLNKILSINKFDLIFIFPVESELELLYVRELSNHSITLAYFYDDTWRIKYSLEWISVVNYIVTTDVNWPLNFSSYIEKVIYCPFFVNNEKYVYEENCKKIYDVTFVGQYHPSREWFINLIKKSGIDVNVYGKGWGKNSEIDFEKMVQIFNQSKINLNLSNCINFDIRHLLDFKNNKIISLLRSYKLFFRSLYNNDMKIYEMAKARFFEINACGGFQISFYAQGLETLYSIGEEIQIFENSEQLIRKIKFYLKNENERNVIAKNGYIKTLEMHTSTKRIKYILDKINFFPTNE